MQANFSSTKISEMTSKVIDKVVMTFGTLAIVWIMAFLLVAMIDK